MIGSGSGDEDNELRTAGASGIGGRGKEKERSDSTETSTGHSGRGVLSKVLSVARRAGGDKVNQFSIATYSYSNEKYRLRTLRRRLLHLLHRRQRYCRRRIATPRMSSHSLNDSRSDPILTRLPYLTLRRSYLV